MTYREAVRLLEESGVESAAFDAAEIFCHFEKVTKASLFSDCDKSYDSPKLLSAIERRIKREPLQYILGEWEFFGIRFEVNPSCLCPRADTEITVETVIKLLPPGARFLELCTGSGCIPIAICREREDVFAVSTDAFEDTLNVARRNAELNGVSDRIKFICSDIFKRELDAEDGCFDAIVSNPPYIPSVDVDGLSPEVQMEPKAALDGGADGLDFYREILGYYKRFLKKDGFIALEIGYDQGKAVSDIAKANLFGCILIKDLGGNDRCAVCRPIK